MRRRLALQPSNLGACDDAPPTGFDRGSSSPPLSSRLPDSCAASHVIVRPAASVVSCASRARERPETRRACCDAGHRAARHERPAPARYRQSRRSAGCSSTTVVAIPLPTLKTPATPEPAAASNAPTTCRRRRSLASARRRRRSPSPGRHAADRGRSRSRSPRGSGAAAACRRCRADTQHGAPRKAGSTPAARAASSARTVPTTFTSASKAGRSTDVPMSACAARWNTTSGRSRPRSILSASSRMSTSWSATSERRLSRDPVARLSTTCTSCPRPKQRLYDV